MKQKLLCLSLLVLPHLIWAQLYSDYLGNGHNQQITVSSSDPNATPDVTLDGFPSDSKIQLADASRFLAQATLGADYATIQMTAAMGYDAWMEEQFALPPVAMLNEMFRMETIYKPILEEGEEIQVKLTEIDPRTGKFRLSRKVLLPKPVEVTAE